MTLGPPSGTGAAVRAAGVHIEHLVLKGAGDAALGERFAAALGEQLSARGIETLEVGRLQLDVRGLAPGDAAAIVRLAASVADRIAARRALR